MAPHRSVSIVIPTFNRAALLRRAIDTALAQTIACEVIVSDHGSTDDTPGLVQSYGPQVSYLRRAKDNGPFFAWLDGVVNASSEYIHLTYDDDWIDRTFVERCLSLFTPDCAFVFTGAEVHAENGGLNRLFHDLFETGTHPARKIESLMLSMSVSISPGCALFRKKDIIPAIGIGDLPMAKSSYRGVGRDMLMFLLPLLKYSKFGFVNESLAHFLAHPGSITIEAGQNLAEKKQLLAAYKEAKYYYLRLKAGKYIPMAEIMYGWSALKKRAKKPFRGRTPKSRP